MNELAKKLLSETHEEFSHDIKTFLETYKDTAKFEELDNDSLREKLWDLLYSHLKDATHLPIHFECMVALKILSRDKTKLDQVITPEIINIILKNAGLLEVSDKQQMTYTNVTIASLQLLCNLLYNTAVVRESPLVISSLPNVVERTRNYTDDVPFEVKLFNMRILFLITALNSKAINIVRTDLSGDIYLIELLEELFKKLRNGENGTVVGFEEEDVTLICEVLKVLFNLYSKYEDLVTEEEKCSRLLLILRAYLVNQCHGIKQEELQSNIVNLLTAIPNRYYRNHISGFCRLFHDLTPLLTLYMFDDVSAIRVLLEFLDKKLNVKEDLIENISPIVTVLIGVAKSRSVSRRYLRVVVLPPLKYVTKRPEEGTSLKAKLCKLLTSPLTDLRDLVAEFLFELCKKNVSRMIKYTGYGNAAGMLANKGLLGCNRMKSSYHYSDSDTEPECSETEEYSCCCNRINLVTGCIEEATKNPLEEMTEEQKEYAAIELVGLLGKLAKIGGIHPCRIGKDGKPEPIEHVLQLQEELPKQQCRRDSSESD